MAARVPCLALRRPKLARPLAVEPPLASMRPPGRRHAPSVATAATARSPGTRGRRLRILWQNAGSMPVSPGTASADLASASLLDDEDDMSALDGRVAVV